MIRRAYTSCRYGQMHYLEGQPQTAAAPTLVLLHQNPSSSFEYAGLLAEMAKDRWVIALDTPGYGMSDAPPAPPGMAGYAAAFSDGLDALGVTGPIDIYGFHTGTLLATELALARPDLVGRVALSGIPMLSLEERAKHRHKALNFPQINNDGEAIFAHLRTMWDYVVASRDTRVPMERALLNYSDRIRTLNRYTWAYQGVWDWDFEQLRKITQPTLLLQPHEDLLAVSRQAAGLIPDHRIVELPDLDRDIFEVGVPQIAAALRAFFTP